MALSDYNSISTHLGGNHNWSQGQIEDAIDAASNIAVKVTNRTLEQTTHRLWRTPSGLSMRSDVLLGEYPIISLNRAYSSSVEGGRITDAGGDLVTISVVDGTLFVGAESFDLSSYNTMAALETAVDATAYSMSVTTPGDPQDVAVDSLGILKLPDTYCQIEILSHKQARVRGSWSFLEYVSGYSVIPAGLKNVVNQFAVALLESGAPRGGGLGQQLDKASETLDVDAMLDPWKRITFSTWHGRRSSGQVTENSNAGWIELN